MNSREQYTTDYRPDNDKRFSNAQLIAAIEAIPAGFCLYDSDDRLVLYNQRYREVYSGHADMLVVGERFEDMLRAGVERGEFADAIGREEEWIAERLRCHANPQGPIEQRLSNGRWLQIEERRTRDGETIGLRTDITNLKTLELSHKQNEERFRDFAAASADWFWEMNADLRFTYMSGNVERIIGVPPEWHYGKSRKDLLGDDYDRETWEQHLETLRNHLPFRNFEYLRVGHGVEPKWLRTNGIPKFAEDGSFLGYRGTGSDVTLKRAAEEELRRSESSLARAQHIARFGNWDLNLATGELYWSDAVFEIFRVERETFDRTSASFYSRVHPDDREHVRQAVDAAINDRKPYSIEHRIVLPDGEERIVHERAEVEIDKAGNPVFMRGTMQDITERKRAEEKFHASEAQLFQSQKMDAIGQLTGGIAHDFNNLLSVIQGNLELIDEQVKDSDLKSMIGASLRAVAHGARLTGQLLMFGRKALLTPVVIDVNRSVSAMGELIRRTVPATIEIETALANDLWYAELDPSQLEAAILNVIINATYAMPEGGRLKIATANANLTEGDLARFACECAPGRYVTTTASDTGHGMDCDTVARAFDPFFTTKPVGQGSGLGLSMVHGFARHSGGDVLIDSAPGQGTTVTLYFPACRPGAVPEPSAPDQVIPRAAGGECVLVVEDQADVRRAVAAQLGSLGYEVIEAADGVSALAVLCSDVRVDILLTDMVMPGKLQGSALAERARIVRPGIGVVLMTGYPSDTAADSDRATPEYACLNKPISKGELARKIWKQLNGGQSE